MYWSRFTGVEILLRIFLQYQNNNARVVVHDICHLPLKIAVATIGILSKMEPTGMSQQRFASNIDKNNCPIWLITKEKNENYC